MPANPHTLYSLVSVHAPNSEIDLWRSNLKTSLALTLVWRWPTCPTEVTEVRVALSYSQEAGAMFSVAGSRPTTAARETILAVWATVAVLLTEVGGEGTTAGAGAITRLPGVEARLVVVPIGSLALQLGLDLAMMVRPCPHISFLLLPGQSSQSPHPLRLVQQQCP